MSVIPLGLTGWFTTFTVGQAHFYLMTRNFDHTGELRSRCGKTLHVSCRYDAKAGDKFCPDCLRQLQIEGCP